MARNPSEKILNQTRLANNYGGWIYCDHCGKNIGYLCYVTYNSFQFKYTCKCGSRGSMQIVFQTNETGQASDAPLV